MDVETFNKLLLFALERGMSDIHLEVGYSPHYRLRGELVPTKLPVLKPKDTEDLGKLLLEGRGIDLHKPFPEMDVSYAITGKGRFRASVFRQRGSVGIVLRAIPFDVKSLTELNLPVVLQDIAMALRGLILVTGATGQGKSTTMAAMIRFISEARRVHIVTIEDPIEFVIQGGSSIVVQRELGNDTESFQSALQAALRQDPDVIFVGEIRNCDTAEICLKAAETGHLVLSTLHTPDAMTTIQRYMGMFPSAQQDAIRERLAEQISGVVSLRLLPMKSGAGRIPGVEIMRATPTIRDCLRHPARLGELQRHIIEGRALYGMQLFDQHLLDLATAGYISVEVASLAASSAEEFQRSLTIE